MSLAAPLVLFPSTSGGGGSPSLWSQFPALQNVNMDGFDIKGPDSASAQNMSVALPDIVSDTRVDGGILTFGGDTNNSPEGFGTDTYIRAGNSSHLSRPGRLFLMAGTNPDESWGDIHVSTWNMIFDVNATVDLSLGSLLCASIYTPNVASGSTMPLSLTLGTGSTTVDGMDGASLYLRTGTTTTGAAGNIYIQPGSNTDGVQGIISLQNVTAMSSATNLAVTANGNFSFFTGSGDWSTVAHNVYLAGEHNWVRSVAAPNNGVLCVGAFVGGSFGNVGEIGFVTGDAAGNVLTWQASGQPIFAAVPPPSGWSGVSYEVGTPFIFSSEDWTIDPENSTASIDIPFPTVDGQVITVNDYRVFINTGLPGSVELRSAPPQTVDTIADQAGFYITVSLADIYGGIFTFLGTSVPA